MSALDKIIFGKKKFSAILHEIHFNQKKKQDQINELIKELKPLIKDIGDATIIVPLLKEYLEIGVKNDEQLVKLASIIQRIVQSEGNESQEDGSLITEEEKAQLLEVVKNLNLKNE